MPPRTVVRHRALWISDVHLGSASCKAGTLAAFLRRNEAEQLYLVGDIFDGWKLKSGFHWTREQTDVINVVLDKARRGTRVYYITGNHDAFLRQFIREPLQFGNIGLVNEVVHTTADGRRLLVMHGDAFDSVVAALPRLSLVADNAYNALIWLNQRLLPLARRVGLEQWSLSGTAKTLVKGAVQYLSGFDDQVIFRCRRDRLQGVICGHTHHPAVNGLRDDITSYNCGDWVESCTALAEDFHGHISILKGAAAPLPARAAPVPKLRPRARPGPLIIASPAVRGLVEGAVPIESDDLGQLSAAASRRGTPDRNHRSENRPRP